MYEIKYTRKEAAQRSGWNKYDLAVILEEGYITADDDGFISLEDVKILSDADGYRLKGLEWDKAFRYAKEDAETLD